AGLRIALAPADFAARDLGQVLELLRLVAVLEQRGAEHPDAKAVERRTATERAHFLAQHVGLVLGQATAAVFARPGGHRPPALGHAMEPGALRLGLKLEVAPTPAGVGLARGGAAHFGRAVGFEPRAGLAAEGVDVGAHAMWDLARE